MQDLSKEDDSRNNKCNIRNAVTSYRLQRQARVKSFLQSVSDQRDRYFERLVSNKKQSVTVS